MYPPHESRVRRLPLSALLALLAGPIWLGCRDGPVAPRRPAMSPSVALAVTGASDVEDLALLRLLIGRLQTDGTLNAGQANALTTKLDAAARRSDAGNKTGGNFLGAFTNQIQAFLNARVLSATQAQPLLDAVLSLTGSGVRRQPLAAGYRFTCALTPIGSTQCWGSNQFGQLGDGTTELRLEPVTVPGPWTFRQITAGSDHACALTGEGVAYCWGGNASGQLGDATTTDRRTPTAAATVLRFIEITAGAYHTCGLTRDGKAYCWGRNYPGVLGDGTVYDRNAPTPVTGGLVFSELRAGGFHTCGIDTASTTYCWGWNYFGELGDGTLTDRQSPTRVAGATRFTRIAGHAYDNCALTATAQAYCWGLSERGNIVPEPVVGGISFASLGEGGVRGTHTCAVSVSGPTFCWGPNNYGQIGDGTNIWRSAPTMVAGGLTFTYVTGGGEHNCARTAAGAIYCWGGNFNGQLGDGTTTSRNTPTLVSGAGP